MNDWRCFPQPMRASDIHSVAIAVPDHFHSRKRMVPPKIHAADAWPVWREFAVLDSDLGFLDGKDSTRTKDWNALRSRLQFMRWIARDNRFLFIFAVMADIRNRHHDFEPVV